MTDPDIRPDARCCSGCTCVAAHSSLPYDEEA